MSTVTASAVTSSDGTTIAFDRYGEGPSLIFVNGATAIRAYDARLANVLASNFTVYAYDRRGRGDSGDTPPYAVEREIEDLDAVIQVAGGSAFVLGFSSGAVLALRAAASGLDIAKLAVYEPPFIVDDSRPPIPDDYVEQLDTLVAEGRRDDAWAYFMTTAAQMPEEVVAGMLSEPWVQSMEEVAHTIAYDGRVMGDTMSGKPLSPKPWNAITVPTLVMDGGASPDWMRNSAQALASILPDVQHRTLEGQDHGPADDVLAPVVIEFFMTDPGADPQLSTGTLPLNEDDETGTQMSNRPSVAPLPDKMAAPAQRALAGAGVTTLNDLTRFTEAEVLALHGMGPKVMEQLRHALAEWGLSFADDQENR